jgi:ABC-type multidrug transport system fused ATPase/permease subunit
VARELQRLDALTRSPIYAHFGETLGGLTAIRAFGHMNRFARVNERMIDNNLRAYLAKKVRTYTCVDKTRNLSLRYVMYSHQCYLLSASECRHHFMLAP